jgi:two-component system, OmpR family, sensor histidine kinase ArlS
VKLRNKLTLLFTLLAGAILLVFAVVVYLSAEGDRQAEFYQNLRKEAMTRANLVMDAGIDAEILQTIYLQNREILSEVEVAIYDTRFNLVYHDAEDIDFVKETPEMIREIVEKGEIRFTQEGWEVIGVLFQFNDTPFVVTAAAFDEYGHNKLAALRNKMSLLWLAAVVLIFFSGKYFAFRALRPVAQMVEKADAITATNMDLRLNEGKGEDELSELAETFNRMLDRLEASFDAQKEFVSNIAHEVRTPLAAIMGECELAMDASKSPEACRQALDKVHEDARKLSRLVTGLLDLARASYDHTEISLREVRLDEVLVEARRELLNIHPDYKVNLEFDPEMDDEGMITVNGNHYLLKVAFMNLMENGCKFSENKTSLVNIRFDMNHPVIRFADQGVGIPEEEIQEIFTPFYRGKNHQFAQGSGIGLSLTEKIMNLHQATIGVDSAPGQGTRIEVRFSSHLQNPE